MKNRLASGGASINRDKPLHFKFNGQAMRGFAGDTIASALLANGARVVARSFKYHRPRGIYGIGAEEPNAVFTVGHGGAHTPNVRATITPLEDGMDIRPQSGWPSPRFDVGAAVSFFAPLLPAGFYYKTFMRPAKLWMTYEKIIRRAASAAPPPREADAAQYTHRHAHCDVLVAGGGPAGLAAARAAARAGADVILADMGAAFGGRLLAEDGGDINGKSARAWLAETVAELQGMENVTLLPSTTVQGYHDYNYLVAAQSLKPGFADGLRQRLWKIRARRAVVAAGAIERPPVFAGNDSPGVMSAAAVGAYIRQYGVLPGRNILFFTNNDSAYDAALAAAAAGARVEIADLRSDGGGHWRMRAKAEKIRVYNGACVMAARAHGGKLAVQLGRFRSEENAAPFAAHAYDIVAVSAGWTPTAHLFSQARGALAWSERLHAFKPDTACALNPCRAAGAANGALHLSQCLGEGHDAGIAAAAACGFAADAAADAPRADAPALEETAVYPAIIPAPHAVGRGPGKHFVDFMNDVTAADIQLAAREGYQAVEHMKRYTVAGFGSDQGKTGNINALVLLAKALGKTPAETGHTTYRPQFTPTALGLVAGGDRRDSYAPARATPMDAWHRAQGAVYEDVGDWKRPRYFPRGGETMDDAVWRECKAARGDVAAMDASTLGKIDIQGADAGKFLDMIYTNQFSALPAGRCRYGLMLRETGMIFDDGVTARLGENHFHMTTSTGHAAAVMNWLEEWLQTEWPHLRVFCTSVTEQWAVIALVGPKARALLAETTDMPLGADEFPFMSFREGIVAGAPARVFRISFSGEPAFEINVPAALALSVWETLFQRGEKHGITAYGTESMHVLRAEKGYIIVGQDADGTATPDDMGLSWMVSKKKKDFLGRRSLARPDMKRAGRLQLVGLLPEDPKAVIAEGAHIIAAGAGAPPLETQGHVTSSYMSPALERSFALAMLSDGFSRHGESVQTLFMDGKRLPARVTGAVFWDKEGKRLRG